MMVDIASVVNAIIGTENRGSRPGAETVPAVLTVRDNSNRWILEIDPIVKHPSRLDLGDYLPYLVNRVGTIIAGQFTVEALAAHRLSIAMWRVMVMLASKASLRQIDLADLTSIEVSTLSRLVTRLVRVGLLTRTRSANSDREVTVRTLGKGEKPCRASHSHRAPL